MSRRWRGTRRRSRASDGAARASSTPDRTTAPSRRAAPPPFARTCAGASLTRQRLPDTWQVWAVDDSKLVRSLDGHAHWVNCLALSTDAAHRAGPYDHRGTRPADADAALAAASERHASARGPAELLASGSDDFTLYLWSPASSKKPIARLTGHVQLVNAAAFSADGNWLASGSFDGSIRLWAARTGEPFSRATAPAPAPPKASPVVTLRAPSVSGKFVATLRGHVGAVYQLCWSADSRLLASGSKDSTVKVRRRHATSPTVLPRW